ncbi:hypothetical protein GCM10009792_19750 [Microcella alkalica]|uniref:Uncharacterized protein n=1 Tax=Microcella alkalica TaxID=355930 RepID=A0A839E7A7_9MICO|nr:hypothetical protein [Microcella alkalica]MBA8847397.1 hypothetical protein [Microcella alkalica]
MTAWHPVLAAHEQTPGVWFLTAQTGAYAAVRLIEIAGDRGYRATTYAQPRRFIGYRRTLRSGCELAHQNWIKQHGPHPDPATIYPNLNGDRGAVLASGASLTTWEESASSLEERR